MSTRIESKNETIIIPDTCKERFLPMREPQAQPLHDSGIFLGGISALRGNYLVERSGAEFHVLLYTVSGKGIVQTGEHRHTLNPGTLFVGPAGCRYQYAPADGKPWDILWFHVWNTPQWGILATESAQIRKASALPEVELATGRMLAESVSGDPTRRKAARLFAELVVVYLEREFENELTPVETQLRERIDALWSHVHANLQHNWTIRELAARAEMSPSHFHRVVLRLTGVSPKQMVTELRMQRAANLLLHHDTPLRVVASLVGYGTPFAFSAAFKRHEGVSPHEFRCRGGSTAGDNP